MDSENPQPASTAHSEKSVGSPPPRSASTAAAKPASSGLGKARTEVPIVPQSIQDIPRLSRDEMVPIGNRQYELMLRMRGELGLFMDRIATLEPDVNIPINSNNYWTAVSAVLRHVLMEMQVVKRDLSDTESRTRVNRIADTLADGVAVMTYLKLRAINLYRLADNEHFLMKPKVPEHFEVPLPYGYAISQLGVVEVSSLPKRMVCYPIANAAEAGRYLLPAARRWSQSGYAEAVRYAKDLGMKFVTLDLSVKVGSAWWLFEQTTPDEEMFTLQCPLPEDNFTEAAAVVHTIFCNDGNNGLANAIFDVSSLGHHNYGSFIRGPRDDISYASYYAITGEIGEEPWKSAE